MNINNILDNLDYLRQKEKTICEESTKNYLIYPFMSFLGYSMDDPTEVAYEYECDMHENGNRKVDCAILDNNLMPLIIIEAKALGKDLTEYVGQLKSYFVSSGAEYAVLTDGNIYMIFEKSQINYDILNAAPRYTFRLDGIKKEDYSFIKALCKINLKSDFIPERKAVDSEIIDNKSENKEHEHIADQNDMALQKRNALEQLQRRALEQFTQTGQLIGRTLRSIYQQYLDYVKQCNIQPVSLNKFENQIQELLSCRVVSREGIKYIVRDDITLKIINEFCSYVSLNKIIHNPCDDVYKLYKTYCQENGLYTVSGKQLRKEIVQSFENIKLSHKNIDGIPTEYYIDSTDENNNNQFIKSLSPEYHTLQEFFAKIPVESVINKPTNEVYKWYCEYCNNTSQEPISQISFSKKLKQKYNVKIVDKKIKGKKYRLIAFK